MALPLALLAPILSGLGQSKQNAMNFATTLFFNKQQRDYNEHMYGQQRKDALADWNMMNEYNSPQKQMERFKAAGLNPNLIYGQTNEASPVRSSSVSSWNPEHPRLSFDPSSQLAAFYDAQMKTAQIDNLKQATAVAAQEAILKSAQVGATLAQTAKTSQDTTQAAGLYDYSVQAAKLNLDRITQEMDLNLQRNEREIAMNAANLNVAAQNILLSRAQTAKTEQERQNLIAAAKIAEQDLEIKKVEVELRKAGQSPNDPAWQRQLGMAIRRAIEKAQRKDEINKGGATKDKPYYPSWLKVKEKK